MSSLILTQFTDWVQNLFSKGIKNTMIRGPFIFLSFKYIGTDRHHQEYSANGFKEMMYSNRYHPESETRKFYEDDYGKLRATTQKEDKNLLYRSLEIWGKLSEQSVCRKKLNCEICTRLKNDYMIHKKKIETSRKVNKLQGKCLSKREAHHDLMENFVLTDILKKICEKNGVKMIDYLNTMSAKDPHIYKKVITNYVPGGQLLDNSVYKKIKNRHEKKMNKIDEKDFVSYLHQNEGRFVNKNPNSTE